MRRVGPPVLVKLQRSHCCNWGHQAPSKAFIHTRGGQTIKIMPFWPHQNFLENLPKRGGGVLLAKLFCGQPLRRTSQTSGDERGRWTNSSIETKFRQQCPSHISGIRFASCRWHCWLFHLECFWLSTQINMIMIAVKIKWTHLLRWQCCLSNKIIFSLHFTILCMT